MLPSDVLKFLSGNKTLFCEKIMGTKFIKRESYLEALSIMKVFGEKQNHEVRKVGATSMEEEV